MHGTQLMVSMELFFCRPSFVFGHLIAFVRTEADPVAASWHEVSSREGAL
jgi:hypothetical protein